jgi:hypothetical protein
VAAAVAVGVVLALVAAASADPRNRGSEPTLPPTTTSTVAPPTTTSTAEPTTPTESTTTSTSTESTIADTTPPETTIAGAPKKVRTRKRFVSVSFSFGSSEPGSAFACAVDNSAFTPCTPPNTVTLRKGRHVIAVRATDQAGNADPTPATAQVKVKRKRKRR